MSYVHLKISNIVLEVYDQFSINEYQINPIIKFVMPDGTFHSTQEKKLPENSKYLEFPDKINLELDLRNGINNFSHLFLLVQLYSNKSKNGKSGVFIGDINIDFYTLLNGPENHICAILHGISIGNLQFICESYEICNSEIVIEEIIIVNEESIDNGTYKLEMQIPCYSKSKIQSVQKNYKISLSHMGPSHSIKFKSTSRNFNDPLSFEFKLFSNRGLLKGFHECGSEITEYSAFSNTNIIQIFGTNENKSSIKCKFLIFIKNTPVSIPVLGGVHRLTEDDTIYENIPIERPDISLYRPDQIFYENIVCLPSKDNLTKLVEPLKITIKAMKITIKECFNDVMVLHMWSTYPNISKSFEQSCQNNDGGVVVFNTPDLVYSTYYPWLLPNRYLIFKFYKNKEICSTNLIEEIYVSFHSLLASPSDYMFNKTGSRILIEFQLNYIMEKYLFFDFYGIKIECDTKPTSIEIDFNSVIKTIKYPIVSSISFPFLYTSDRSNLSDYYFSITFNENKKIIMTDTISLLNLIPFKNTYKFIRGYKGSRSSRPNFPVEYLINLYTNEDKIGFIVDYEQPKGIFLNDTIILSDSLKNNSYCSCIQPSFLPTEISETKTNAIRNSLIFDDMREYVVFITNCNLLMKRDYYIINVTNKYINIQLGNGELLQEISYQYLKTKQNMNIFQILTPNIQLSFISESATEIFKEIENVKEKYFLDSTEVFKYNDNVHSNLSTETSKSV